jgi:CHRD domain
MQISIIGNGFIGLAIASLLSSGALAETVAFKVNLSAQQEVPTNDSKGTGAADVTFDTATKALTWTVTYSGLTGEPTAAHFHAPAEPGKNAGVVVPIGNKPPSPAKGTATLTDTQASDLMAGRMYINVHTAAHPGGEIRGQVTK